MMVVQFLQETAQCWLGKRLVPVTGVLQSRLIKVMPYEYLVMALTSMNILIWLHHLQPCQACPMHVACMSHLDLNAVGGPTAGGFPFAGLVM